MQLCEIINECRTECLESLSSTSQCFESRLNGVLEKYYDLIRNLDNDEKFLHNVTDDYIQTISKTIETIKQAYKFHQKGLIRAAVKRMKSLVNGELLLEKTFTNDSDKWWYRGRMLTTSERIYSKEQMWHIPCEKRELVKVERYSITGHPCLYLGNSILTCWEELGAPSLDDLCMSAYKIKNTLRVIDLRLPDNENYYLGEPYIFTKLLNTLPLALACFLQVRDHGAPFKPEYVIPQLLMLAIMENDGIAGVVYSSTKRVFCLIENEDYRYNLALPVRKNEDYYLRDYFDNYDGQTFLHADVMHKLNAMLWSGEDVTYADTKFGQMESFLIELAMKEENEKEKILKSIANR